MDAEAQRAGARRRKKSSDELWRRLKEYHEEDEREENRPVIALNNLEVSWDIWSKWRATGKRFLPSQLLAEPQWLLDDLIAIEAAYAIDEEVEKNMQTSHPAITEVDNG